MTNQDSKTKNDQRRFSQEQYEMLKRCSDKEDMTEWNEWRKKNPAKDVCLDGANLQGFYLKNANFIHAVVSDCGEGKKTDYSGKVYLREANLRGVNAEQASFSNARLEKTYWWYANARDADFQGAHLEEAQLGVSKLDECRFSDAHVMDASFTPSSLCGANFLKSDLRGCSIRSSVVEGSTRFWECIINRHSKDQRFTDFTGVPLDNVIIDPGTKQLLQYNIRRMNWEEWYKKGWWWQRILKRLFAWPFWLISDYGISTWRVIVTFFGLALFFAVIYANCAWLWPPGIVNNLDIEPHLPLWHYFLLIVLRPVYFSIVTMTTLGFGDMHANPESIWGHVLLTIQVILGYVLLGALVTRFAVLFTAGGPAGGFADEKKTKAEREKQEQAS
jgi:uncharacterized protein YjbI with pentapeptide repeats